MASRKQSVHTKSVAALNLVNNSCKDTNSSKLLTYKKLEDEEKSSKELNRMSGNNEIMITPTKTVTNSIFSSSIASTTATTISSKQNYHYSNLISNLFGSRIYDSGIRNVTNFSFNSMDLSLMNSHKDSIKTKRGYREVSPKSNKSNKEVAVKSAKSNKEIIIRSNKTILKEPKFRLTRATDKLLDSTYKNFSSVLKGNYTTYRKKYLEGPVVGRGSFGVVKTLFSMVEILHLYQYIPTKNRPPINNLSKGITRLSDNNYEFCGVKLTSPTRAAKIMNFDKIKKTGPKNLLHILREVSIGSWNDHPNIVKVKEIYLDEQILKYLNNINNLDDKEMVLTGKNNNVYLVMEYCSGGDLSRLFIDELDKETIIPKLFVQIFRALSYINSKGIAHRDVKPENFLITHKSEGADVDLEDKGDLLYDDITIKLADFGLANSSPRLLKTRAGTPYYVAPEIIKCSGNNYYNVKCDSWSAGIMLHIFLLGSCPFHDESDVKKLNKVVNQEIDWTHEIYATIPPEAYDLLKKLLVKNPSKRISTTDSLKHLYFRKFTGYARLHRTINETSLIDMLAQFYKFPILKRVALCIMIRQMSEYKLGELCDLYKYLTTFSNDLNSLNIQSLTKFANHRSTDLNRDKNYNHRISRLNYLKESLNIDDITFTEFVASQMAYELCQNNDLIANVFAGLHSDLPGRRSLFINEQDLERLTTNYTHHSNKLDLKLELMEDRRRSDTQMLNNIKFILNDACEYADSIYDENKTRGSTSGLGGFLRSNRGNDKESSMSIDEFFLMMSFNPEKESEAEESRLARIKRKRIK
ncbi:protein kinase [Theileria orientalis]|uniref:Protein kinase n=1 Tax=Theileria orientalis TaxID=68886 RepID=A0A976MDB4_THEOR|nr:protein kinase [Theileria orientalis]